METTLTGTPRITIRGNWDIGVIEIHIKEYLSQCEMWGDLNISLEEYDHIKSGISGALGKHPTAREVIALIRKYPKVMVTDIISYVLYEYNNNEFWSGWASRYGLGLTTSNQTEIGRMVRDIFERYDFKVIEDGGFVYVTPILCQAGIPSTCFDKLFDILDCTLNSSYFMAREIVSELMGYRSYLIDIPVERYFKLHTERAIELIVQLREMMHTVSEHSIGGTDAPDVPGVQPRIVKRYVIWSAEIKKLGKRNRNTTQYYFSPKLVYDETRGICLFIPEQTLRQDSIYKLKWTIMSDGNLENVKTVYAQVYNDKSRNYTYEVNVPVDFAEQYTIQLWDNDHDSTHLTEPWIVQGLGPENEILTFSESGSLLPKTQRYISRKGSVIVFDSNQAKIIELQSVNKIDINLPKNWASIQALCAYPTDKNARVTIQTISGIINIEAKQSFDIELIQIGTLFDEKYHDKETPVYIRFPTVEAIGNIDQYNQELFNTWQVVIIHRLTNTKHTAMVTELGLKVYGDRVQFDLRDYAQEHYAGLYGAYDLKVYDGKTRKYFTFYLSPEIKYIAHVEEIESDRQFENRRAAFYVQNNEAVTLEFENGSGINCLPAYNRGADWQEISSMNKPAYISGQVVFRDSDGLLKIPFRKTIRKLEWSFWDERENDLLEVGKAKQFYLEDFNKTTWRFALRFTDPAVRYDAIKLILEASNSEQLQSKDILLDESGNGSITLNLFQDTMAEHLLPQRLMLYITKGYDDYMPICIAVVKSYVQLKNPKYTISHDRPTLYWEPGHNNEFLNKRLDFVSLNDLDLEHIKYPLNKRVQTFKGKADKRFEGFVLEKPLMNGIYYVDAKEDLEFSFFEDEEPAIPVYDRQHIICVNGKQFLEEFFIDKSNQVIDWLSATTITLHKLEWIIVLLKKLRVQVEQGKMIFDPKGCAPLLFLLLINSGEKSNLAMDVKLNVKAVCELISSFLMTNTDRLKILNYLLESSLSDNDCQIIINELQLYMFSPNNSVIIKKISVQRMWDLNPDMAILMNVRNCVSNNSVDIERVLSKIGFESLEEIIKIAPKANCDSPEWTDCLERIVSGQCQCNYVKFECSKRVWGDGTEYSGLFIADRRGNWSRQTPDESHTDGYELFGNNYLTLIFGLTPEIQDAVTKEYIEYANQEIYKSESLTLKYVPLFPNFHQVLKHRLTDNAGRQRLFYHIGCSSVLAALSTRKTIASADLQELLPFWKNAMGAYPGLVYRDLILAELYILCINGRRN